MAITVLTSYEVDSAGADTGTLTTPSFTPQTGDCFVLKGNSEDSTGTLGTPTNTGSSITWTATQSNATANHTYNTVWRGVCTSGGVATTVSLPYTAGTGLRHSMVLEPYRNAKFATTPALVATVTGSGAPSSTLTTAANGSIVSWICGDWSAQDGVSRVYRSSAVETGYRFVTGASTVYYAYQQAGAAGSQTVGLTAPVGQTWTLLGVEVQDAGTTGTVEGAQRSGLRHPGRGPRGGRGYFQTRRMDTEFTGLASGSPVTASPGGIGSAEVFGAVVAALSLIASPSGIGSSETFGTPTASTSLTASPTGIGSSEAFGTPTASSGLSASPTGISSAEAFGTPAAVIPITASPAGIASGESFGVPVAGGTLTVSPTGVGSAESFGTPVASTALTASPTGIASGQAFGTPTAAATLTASPTGISSGEAFGTATAVKTLTASPSGIASGEAFGLPAAIGSGTVSPAGIPSAEAFGVPTVVVPITAAPAGIPSSQAFGVPVVLSTLTVSPSSVPSSEAFGVPRASGLLTASPDGIASAEAFGAPTVTISDVARRDIVVEIGQPYGNPIVVGEPYGNRIVVGEPSGNPIVVDRPWR